ncbi:MAG: efflux transporter periplasmic adaptor subunit [Gammaproteobacteria bacterium HGW-Gammaproteobacteria-3]|nr:MAG: efflux transporter periplasmic adaptor subunit [Gammaproteobacteria bacterium HGW-Gammaproteobacteria-3]
MIKRLLIIVMATVLIFGGLFALKFFQVQKELSQMQPPPPAVVAVTEVKQLEWQSSLTAIGSLVAVAGVDVANEIAGIVKAIHFTSGQNVKKGQLLVELDSATEQSELNGLLAQQRLAQIQFERSGKLIVKKFVSQSDYDQNSALLDQANADVRSKKTEIAKKLVRAPFTGKLGISRIDLGQYLTPGSAIVTLQQLTPIYLDFNLPERHLSALALNQEINVSTQAYPAKVFKGRISATSPLIDRNTRSVQVRATLANTDQLLRPGMFAQVQVLSNQPRSVLILPDTAISYNPYGDFVFVVEKTSEGLTVQSRQVTTGETRAGQVEIVKGLKPGERVVSAGQVKLRNGMPIIIENNSASS